MVIDITTILSVGLPLNEDLIVPEAYDGKLSCTVLRGQRERKIFNLLGQEKIGENTNI